ncbi:MAG: putative non-F420 flavinoid oxidoreductase [Acidimicrobiales bacterium]|nr:putative non-F420 flavinoid oxidoreductase [Acidimicrobiales bacterium]
MPRIGYHASHEQHPPRALLDDVRHARAAGFDAVTSSDHLAPWSTSQGHSGHAWAWLGAAMQAVEDVPFGVVTAPGQRYHPAVLAQAIATLAEMHPGRLTVALGSGEALNEHVTGTGWPRKEDRNARLLECVGILRALLAGEEVDHDGHVRVDRARLWSLPEVVPPLIGAALSVETARWCGSWADGLITIHQPPEQLRQITTAFRDGGGIGKPITVQVKLAWGASDQEARHGAWEQWRTNVFESARMADLETVADFEGAARHVTPDDIEPSVFASSDLARHRDLLHEILDCDVDHLSLHHVPKPQRPFIEAFAQHVLPDLRAG